MARRVVMGQRSPGNVGMWVSKPGFDAVTTAPENLMLSTDIGNVQAVASGIISSPGEFTTVNFTNLGFQPWVLLSSQRWQCNFSYLSNSSVSIARGSLNPIVGNWNVGSVPNFADEIRYVILNIPRA